MKRRHFISSSSAALAFSGLQRLFANSSITESELYGPLLPDPEGLLDLPKGFSYKIISRRGDRMSDGFKVPGQPDGMACFPQESGKVLLVRNHELKRKMTYWGPFDDNTKVPDSVDPSLVYNPGNGDLPPCQGGTTTILYNPKTGKTEKQFLSLTGTDVNCAGGPVTRGNQHSWITCEETESLNLPEYANHGWCFEVKADVNSGLQKPIPLKALGRFRHEAIAYEESTGIVYLTEDRHDGLLYRFVPDVKGSFESGKLEALGLVEDSALDIRNYDPDQPQIKVGDVYGIQWIPLSETDAPKDDLRIRGHKAGAKFFARGEGITILNGQVYICCTSGGNARQGQIFRITTGPDTDTLELFLQPTKSDLLTNGDNICIGANNHLIICEDLVLERKTKKAHVRAVTQDGKIHTIARNAHNQHEFAGSCFDEASGTLFFNMQSPGITFAVTGPWKA